MELLLVRHAAAEARRRSRADARRGLTEEGRKRFRRCVRALERMGLRLDRIYHSPLLRAVETADLLAPLLRGESVVTSHLAAPPGDPLLRQLAGERAALVGHEPYVSQLASLLLFGTTEHAARFPFRKGGAALLTGPAAPGAMRLKAFLDPRQLRRLG